MNQQPQLHAYARPVNSPFGLLGTNENALSFALGYTFQQCLPFLQYFLRQLKITGIQLRSLRNTRIELQRYRSDIAGQGITDIELHLPGHFHIIIEAKVGFALPTLQQCQKYLPHFSDEPHQILVAMVQSPDDSFVERYSVEDCKLTGHLVSFSWTRLFAGCVKLMLSEKLAEHSKNWIRSFYNFLDQEYRMKAFTTEVWIPSINTKPLWSGGMSFWDIHQKYSLYWDSTHPTVRPLYFAFRVHGSVDSIHRVNRIEHSIFIDDIVPELAQPRRKRQRVPCTVWHLDAPVSLPRSLKTGGGMYNRRVRCDLDLLLSCETVQEIEEQMRFRRETGDS
ncbi:hypothetical protein [Planctomicrobium sp. SH527]|uniref:hypothetical protein n=1 Tax=Planctomicrobium sp. SH527 TaxID=3448123 RepID=UPI003F5BDE3A